MAGEIEYYSTFEDIVTLWKSTLTEIENAIPHIKGTVPYINKDTTKYNNSMNGVFYYCSNLKYIPCDIFKNQRNVNDFDHAFFRCSSLVLDVDLTSEIFKGCTKAKSFARTFYGCNGEISYDIFKDCIKAEKFDYCFVGGTWTSTKQNMGCFYHIFRNTKGKNFKMCFTSSTIDYMTEVFTGLKTAEMLSGCFSDIKIVYNIKQAMSLSGQSNCDWRDMFRGCTSITNMSRCFMNVKINKNNIEDFLNDTYYQYILDLRDCKSLDPNARFLGLKRGIAGMYNYFTVDGDTTNHKTFAVIKFGNKTGTYSSSLIGDLDNTLKAESSNATPIIYAKEGSAFYQSLSENASTAGFTLKAL